MKLSREEVIATIRCEIKYVTENSIPGDDDSVTLDIITAEAALEQLEHSEPIVNGVWRYYVNEMGKARWRCSVCGHVVKHDPNDFKRCTCGAHMSKEA